MLHRWDNVTYTSYFIEMELNCCYIHIWCCPCFSYYYLLFISRAQTDIKITSVHSAWRVCVYFATFCHPPSVEPDPHPFKITCAPDLPPWSVAYLILFFFYASANLSLCTVPISHCGRFPQLKLLGRPSSDPRKSEIIQTACWLSFPRLFVFVTYEMYPSRC